MAEITFNHLYKHYTDTVTAVKDFNLNIDDKEFVVFVGPSGCGKSTTLRMVAGLEDISEGELYIGDRMVNNVAPKDRDIAMVFQNYALYPHMHVYDNMAFGLKLRKFKKDEIRKRVKHAATILGIESFLDRKPSELSGGQRQRVALGRAIVREPQVFLMDEPLSNLDAKLRVQMRSEITKLQNRLETTTIYVTHDQTEAMTMADRIVVMRDGVIQQVGAPKELYDFPDNLFVGGFIGAPAMNFIQGRIEQNKFIAGNDTTFEIPNAKMDTVKEYIGKEVIMGIRPEHINDEPAFIESSPGTAIDAYIDVAELMGAETYLYSKIGDDEFVARIESRNDVKNGSKLKLALDMSKALFFDIETENRIE